MMIYQVEIEGTDGYHNVDYFTTKREVVKYIASEMEVTQASIKDEIEAREDSQVYRDSLGKRAFVTYDNGEW
jgi:hypothetical protein